MPDKLNPHNEGAYSMVQPLELSIPVIFLLPCQLCLTVYFRMESPEKMAAVRYNCLYVFFVAFYLPVQIDDTLLINSLEIALWFWLSDVYTEW